METTSTRRKISLGVVLAAVICVGLLALFCAMPKSADAVTSTDKQAEASAVKAQMDSWQETLDQTSDTYNQALMDHDAAVQGMNEAQAKIDEAEAKKASLQEHLSVRARSMYRSGTSSFLDVLLGATSFEDFITTWDTLNDLNAEDAAYVEQAQEAEREATAARDEYAEQERTAQAKLDEAEQAKSEAEATLSEYQSTLDSLDSDVAALVQQQQATDIAGSDAVAGGADGDYSNVSVTVNSDGSRTVSTGGGSSSSSSGSSSSSSSSSSSGGSSGATYDGGSDVVSRAYSCIGAPYEWGAVGPYSYDCSGLVSYCITGRHVRAYTSSSLMSLPAVSNPQPGDVCVKSRHCGIYIGNGKMIHAPQTGYTVCVTNVQSGMKIVRP
jgi:peptidoglycan hydrolase CwlO-like protein